MEGFESTALLYQRLPNLLFVEVRPVPEVVVDLLLDVSGICQFHDDAEGLGVIIKEGFAVVDDVGVADRCEDPYFVEGILSFFFAHLSDFHLP